MRQLVDAIFLLSAALIIFSCITRAASPKAEPKFLVSGSIKQTISYCGGGPPPQKILNSFNTPKGIAFGKLFVKKGIINSEGTPVIDTIKADAKGNFSIYLPAGNYCLVEEWKSKPFKLPSNNVNQSVDSACFRSLYNSPDFTLNIHDKGINDVNIVFHRTCPYNQPCIAYRGPLPQ